MIKLGIDCGYLNVYGFADGLKRMKAQGYECLDYDMADTESGIYLFDDGSFEKKTAEMRDQINGAGIAVNQTHGPWRYPPRDFTEEDRAERLEKMRKSIYATALLGCENIVIHPIMPFGDNSDPDPRRLWDMNLEFFGRLLKTAEEARVAICLENMPMKALSNSRPEAILRFAKELDSRYFKVCLDTGHCAVFGEQPGDAVRLLGREYLRVLHIHDNNGRSDQHLMPYLGVIDWEDFAAVLRDIGFDGCASLETFVGGSAQDAGRTSAEDKLFRGLCHIAGRE